MESHRRAPSLRAQQARCRACGAASQGGQSPAQEQWGVCAGEISSKDGRSHVPEGDSMARQGRDMTGCPPPSPLCSRDSAKVRQKLCLSCARGKALLTEKLIAEGLFSLLSLKNKVSSARTSGRTQRRHSPGSAEDTSPVTQSSFLLMITPMLARKPGF